VIRQFRDRYPNVRLNLHQGTSEQIAEMVAHDRIDCAVATGSDSLFSDLTLMPCYIWHRTVIVPKAHPLVNAGKLSFRTLASYPLITYTFSFTGPNNSVNNNANTGKYVATGDGLAAGTIAPRTMGLTVRFDW